MRKDPIYIKQKAPTKKHTYCFDKAHSTKNRALTCWQAKKYHDRPRICTFCGILAINKSIQAEFKFQRTYLLHQQSKLKPNHMPTRPLTTSPLPHPRGHPTTALPTHAISCSKYNNGNFHTQKLVYSKLMGKKLTPADNY